jgi:hypothetical protein
MAAVVEIDESNGASETVTHAVATLAMGTADASGMTPGAAGARQTAGSNSMQKALRVHMTALGGGLGITGVRVYCDPATAGWSLFTNGHTTQATYDATKRTTYVQPSTGTAPVPNALPTADPASANLGIAGSLSGSLAAAGSTDYLYLQLRASAGVTASFTSPCYFAYDDIG